MYFFVPVSYTHLDVYKRQQLQSAEFASSMMKLGCYLFMAVVGLIGFMHMANTMIMNITTKKQEYEMCIRDRDILL